MDRYLRVRARRQDAAEPWLWLGTRGRLTDSGIAQAVRHRGQLAGIEGLHPHELRHAWGDIPFVVVNDGEVTALAGSMMAGAGAMLGIALGSSQAAGYVDRDGRLTSRIDELAFAPIDDSPDAPVDEWSGDRGCGVQYLSQQATARLMPPAGIGVDPSTPLPQRLVHLQELMAAEDPRAARVYRTVGTYLGYALLTYREHYDLDNLLLLGRVMTGAGGDVIIETARAVLAAEDPGAADAIVFHLADERQKRHGQAVAAASLPARR